MQIKFGNYIVNDNNDNGILDPGIDSIANDGVPSTIAKLESDYPTSASKAGGISFEDSGETISQEQADNFLRELGLDIDCQSPMYDLKTLAINYNWQKAIEYAEKGQLVALQKAMESAKTYSEESGFVFDQDLADQWLVYGAQICYEKNLDLAQQAAKLGSYGTLLHAWENADMACKFLTCDPANTDFDDLQEKSRVQSVAVGLKSAKALAETDGLAALDAINIVERIADADWKGRGNRQDIQLDAKEVKSIRDKAKNQAMDSLIKSAQVAVKDCRPWEAQDLLKKAIDLSFQHSVDLPGAKISNISKQVQSTKCAPRASISFDDN